jgi:rhamnose utilization protein RhaD (predicted bifunctional aldolase and dehydrogenase)
VSDDRMSQLITMSRNLGVPERDYVIQGEGNTSARADATSFWVKGSGCELREITAEGFVRVAFDRVLPIFDRGPMSDQDVQDALEAAKVDPGVKRRPSVETLIHALCLTMEGIHFVGHTHPVPVNALTCSTAFETAFSGRLFPDEIVVCGPAPLLLPYADPGVPLARKVKELMAEYMQHYGSAPRVVLMQNHGMIALGRTPAEVERITAMMFKTARILLGALAAGGPHFLRPEDVERLHHRPDELYRRSQLGVG